MAMRLRTLLGDHPCTAALKNGSIKSDLVEFEFVEYKPTNKGFKPMVREGAFDVSELAIVTYLMAKNYDKPMVLLPNVVMARFQHGHALYNAKRGMLTPADLGGKRVGIRSFTTTTGAWLRGILANEVERVLTPVAKPLVVDPSHKPHVIMMVGVNGTGKTTTIGKLAQKFRAEGKLVVLAAGDTFRAAAIDQLKVWGERTGCPVVARQVGEDASGLAFDALKQAQATGADVLLLDTAGRLQNKQVLMEELEKVIRVLKKLDSTAPHDVILVLDATTGQNALQQVEVFRDRAGVTGLVMTKLDGTARGGILVAIADKFRLPVHAIGVGEGADDLQPFQASEFALAIAGQ